jgi:hypothetical protein
MRSISLCRCGQCRREVGHARASVTAPRVAVAVARPVAWFRLGDEAERGFRPRVSASMFWRMDGADTRSVPLARRDSPARLILEKHIIASHTGDYCEIEGDLPRSP